MAQQQQNISIQAPAFQGINSEDSPLVQDATFSARANNAVIDEYGRLGARKGFNNFIESYDASRITEPAHESRAVTIGAMYHSSGLDPIVATQIDYTTAGEITDTIYRLATINMGAKTLTWLTHSANVLADMGKGVMRADIAAFADLYYVFSKDSPVEVDPVAKTADLLKDQPGFLPPQDGVAPNPNFITNGDLKGDIVTAAYGRLWVTGVEGNYQQIWYSDLKDARVWYDGKAVPTDSLSTAGAIEVSEYWPSGRDRIVNIIAHNNTLVVFGRNNILVYGNPQGDPAAVGGIFLADTIDGMGLVSKDSLVHTGIDLLFVDDTGVRSLGRSIQEQSVPIGDLTSNVRSDISYFILNTDDYDDISLSYWPQEGLVVCNFPENKKAFVLDMRRTSSTGGSRITTWTEHVWDRAIHVEDGVNDRVLLGANDGTSVKEYRGYADNDTDTYRFSYQSNPLTFGDSVREKFPKRMDLTIVTRDAPCVGFARWGSDTLKYSKSLDVESQVPAVYRSYDYAVDAIASGDQATWGQWGNSTYGQSADTIKRYRVNTKGSGAFVTLGVDADINGGVFSLQELNIQTLIGRLY